jgi:hypothetical protein
VLENKKGFEQNKLMHNTLAKETVIAFCHGIAVSFRLVLQVKTFL